ncbi:unnamed protein product, partial [Musa textilis]
QVDTHSESHGGTRSCRSMIRSATRSSKSVNNPTARRAMDSSSECHGTAEAGLP